MMGELEMLLSCRQGRNAERLAGSNRYRPPTMQTYMNQTFRESQKTRGITAKGKDEQTDIPLNDPSIEVDESHNYQFPKERSFLFICFSYGENICLIA